MTHCICVVLCLLAENTRAAFENALQGDWGEQPLGHLQSARTLFSPRRPFRPAQLGPSLMWRACSCS